MYLDQCKIIIMHIMNKTSMIIKTNIGMVMPWWQLIIQNWRYNYQVFYIIVSVERCFQKYFHLFNNYVQWKVDPLSWAQRFLLDRYHYTYIGRSLNRKNDKKRVTSNLILWLYLVNDIDVLCICVGDCKIWNPILTNL